MNTTPITSGSASDYTRTFKKHFGNRPTAFALSPHSHSHSPSTSSSSFSSQTLTSISAGEGRGGVDIDTQNALANLGWKIRSNVNQGYSRSTTTLSHNLCNGEVGSVGFRTEREVLSEVKNGRRGWSRVRTAPTMGFTFDDLRGEDVVMDHTPAPAVEDETKGKRRRNSESESDETQTMQQELQREEEVEVEGERRIKGLPQLSFSSSISSSSSHSSHFHSLAPPELGMKTSLSKSKSSISPFNQYSDQNTRMHDEMQYNGGKLERGSLESGGNGGCRI